MSDEQATQVTDVADGGVVTETQTATETLGFKTEIPASLRGHEAFAPLKTKDDLWNGFIEAVTAKKDLEGKLAGAIPKLSENATADEKAAYLKAIGVPESPDGYEFERPAMPEGVPYNEALEKWFRDTAHKAGISAEQAKTLYGSYNQFGAEFLKSLEVQRQDTLTKGMNALKETWGNHYDDNVAVVKRVQEKIGAASGPMKDWLTAHNAENDPVLIQFLLGAAPAYLDDYAPSGGRPPAGSKANEGMNYKVPNPPPT
jgi:hypothetical protein